MSLVNAETGEVVALETPGLLAKYATPTGLNLPEGIDFEEWSAVGHVLAQMEKGVMWWVGDWWAYGEHAYGERAAQALESGIWSFQTFADAGWVSRKIETSDRSEVLSWTHHRALAPLERDDRLELTRKAEDSEWSLKDLKTEIRLRRTAARIGRAAREAPALESRGEFQVLLVDPPWRYEHAEPTRAIENNYPTMTLDEICALDVPAASDSVLFLWATSPKLSESLTVVDAWDFTYRTCMVWVKDRIGMGYYARQQHELLLIAKRGDLPTPGETDRPPSVVNAPRAEHSTKPEVFHELIERMYPGLARVELFARARRDGWSAWGNQVE